MATFPVRINSLLAEAFPIQTDTPSILMSPESFSVQLAALAVCQTALRHTHTHARAASEHLWLAVAPKQTHVIACWLCASEV